MPLNDPFPVHNNLSNDIRKYQDHILGYKMTHVQDDGSFKYETDSNCANSLFEL